MRNLFGSTLSAFALACALTMSCRLVAVPVVGGTHSEVTFKRGQAPFTVEATAVSGWKMKTANRTSASAWTAPIISGNTASTSLVAIDPNKQFMVKLYGELEPPKGSGQGPIDYSVTGYLEGEFTVTPNENIIALGSVGIFTSKDGTTPVSSTWSISPNKDRNGNPMDPISGESSVTIGAGKSWNPAPGEYIITAQKTGSSDNASATLKIREIAIKLELSGPIKIDTANNYSENANIKVTAVDPVNGKICEWFSGSVQISEDGTSIYSQNTSLGAVLPSSVNVPTGGTTTFIAKSLAEAGTTFLSKPSAAKIKSSNYSIYGGKALEIPQWVDLNSNSRVDWCEQWSSSILASASKVSGEIGVVSSCSSGFGSDFYEKDKYGKTFPGSSKLIYINPAASDHRVNRNKRLTETILHEARHLYLWLQTEKSPAGSVDNDSDLIEDPDNDDDPGLWSDGDELYEIGTYPSEKYVLDTAPLWKGDATKDPTGDVDNAIEFNCNEFAYRNKDKV